MDYSKEILEVDGPKRDMIKSQIQEDYAKADIYFQSLNVQTIAQEKKYSVYSLWNKYEIFSYS